MTCGHNIFFYFEHPQAKWEKEAVCMSRICDSLVCGTASVYVGRGEGSKAMDPNEAPAAARMSRRFFRSFPTSISVIRLGEWHQELEALYSQFPHQQVL